MKGVIALMVVCALAYVSGHTYHVGHCPPVEPVSNFDMDKFLGKWYVIERTSSTSKDFYFVYAKEEGDNQYSVTQYSTKSGLLGSILGDNYSEVGKLTLGDEQTAKMKVKFPLNPASYDYTVFMTDYANYAGVFSCQEAVGVNRRMANILSRTQTLDDEILNNIRRRLSQYGVNPYDLSSIQHTDQGSTEHTDHGEGKIDVRLSDIDKDVVNGTFL